MVRFYSVLLALVFCVGCGAGAPSAPTAPTATAPLAPTVAATMLPAEPYPAPDAYPAPEQSTTGAMATPAELSQRDLAAFLGVDVAAVQIVSVEPVEWNDSSLGCPQPGGVYLQVTVSGYRVTLTAAGGTYVYHTDDRERVVRC